MKTRFSPLIKLKKDAMDTAERNLQQANQTLRLAEQSLDEAYDELNNATIPPVGTMTEFKNSRLLIEGQRQIIQEKKNWVANASDQVEKAKVVLKKAMVDYEKFKYLEAQQIKEELKKAKRREQRDLDEIAVQTYGKVKGTA